MKTKLIFLLSSLLCLSLFSQNYIVNDNFEDDALGTLPNGWVIRYNGTGSADQKIVESPVKNGTHSFQVSGSGWAANISKNIAEIPNEVSFEGWMLAENVVSGGRCGVGIGNPSIGSWGAFIARVEFYNGNLITFNYTGNSGGYGTQYVLQAASSNTWYHTKIVTNTIAGTYKVYLNGELASSDTGGTIITEFPLLPSVSPVSIELYGNSMVYFDDIKLYETLNLVAYYPFNGNANDESGNENHGTVNGATLTSDRFGNANSAYYFDGTSNYISITDNPQINIQNGESYSISYWLKHDAQNNARYMISKYQGSFGEPSYALGTGTYGDAYSWFEFTPSSGIENRGGIDLNDNNWHNITTIFKSGENVSIYIDGVLDISNNITYTGSIINARNLTIGSGSNLAQFYKGFIDDIKIYKKALGEADIQSEVNGLVAYYPFNGNANDESGNENHGTVNGATLTSDRFGNANSAYYFDGVDNDITCLFPGPLGFSARTISFWSRTNEVPHSTWDNAAISYGSNNAYGERFELDINSRSRGLGIDVNGAALTKDFDNSDNEWHFYTAVFDGGINKTMHDVKLYADGNLLITDTYDNGQTHNINTTTEYPLHIGSLFNTYRFFNGEIDEVRIYAFALSEAEVLSLYNTNSLGIEDNRLAKNHKFYVFNNTLYFNQEQDILEMKKVAIYNILAQKVFESKTVQKALAIPFLNQGIYIVKVEFNNRSLETKKIIIK